MMRQRDHILGVFFLDTHRNILGVSAVVGPVVGRTIFATTVETEKLSVQPPMGEKKVKRDVG
jgi:hypothetical protein